MSHVPSTNTEETGFMTCTAASHQEAIETLLHRRYRRSLGFQRQNVLSVLMVNPWAHPGVMSPSFGKRDNLQLHQPARRLFLEYDFKASDDPAPRQSVTGDVLLIAPRHCRLGDSYVGGVGGGFQQHLCKGPLQESKIKSYLIHFKIPGWYISVIFFLKVLELFLLFLTLKEKMSFFISSQISHAEWIVARMFSFLLPPTFPFIAFRNSSLQYLVPWDFREELHNSVLVPAKSTILQQINCGANRNIILNLESWQGKKWEQCEGPVPWSSLKSLSSTHDRADPDCGTDRLWTIISDVFMDFQCVIQSEI